MAARAVGFKIFCVTYARPMGRQLLRRSRLGKTCNTSALSESVCVRSRLAIRAYTEGTASFLSSFPEAFPRGDPSGSRALEVHLPDLVLKGFDSLPVYPVLNVVQHSLSLGSRVNCQVFPGFSAFDHELSGFHPKRSREFYPESAERECVCNDASASRRQISCLPVRAVIAKGVVGGGLEFSASPSSVVSIRPRKAKRLFVSKEMINGL
ncbi:hypothetical protein TNCV_1229391 [Trichonephila clavipes]|nr:hypothetical protein TNCV_1229391 [Trichonephila clavipes]